MRYSDDADGLALTGLEHHRKLRQLADAVLMHVDVGTQSEETPVHDVGDPVKYTAAAAILHLHDAAKTHKKK